MKVNELENVSFRNISNEDVTFLMDLYNFYVKTTTVLFDYELVDSSFISAKYINNKFGFYYLISIGNKKIGFCGLSQFREKEAYKNSYDVSIYVLPEYTGKGIGFKSLIFLEDIAKTNKINNLFATICYENTSSIDLFERYNYKQVAKFEKVAIKFNRKLDVLVFQKNLG